MTNTKAELIAGTLAWCNSIREKKDLPLLDELPKGEVGNPRSCPCGLATGLSVMGGEYAYEYENVELGDRITTRTVSTHDVPTVVQEFVQWFDSNRIPELEVAPHA